MAHASPGAPDGKYSQWMTAVKELDKAINRVGARPQGLDDESTDLVGREDELQRIEDALRRRYLVIVDGQSGTGKTSLLQNGLFRRFKDGDARKRTRKFYIARDWAPLDDKESDTYLLELVKEAHGKSEGLLEKVHEGCKSLQRLLQDESKLRGAVLVLDQFEELLRNNPERAKGVMEWLRDKANAHPPTRWKVLISMRSDSLSLLDERLRGFRPFSVDRVKIGELGLVPVKEIIAGKRRLPESDSRKRASTETGAVRPVADEQVLLLSKLWDKYTPPLLELQATLYALSAMANNRGAGSVEKKDVDELSQNAVKEKEKFFSYGLREYYRLKLGHAATAARQVKLDDYLVVGAEEIIRRGAELLSSGGFKVQLPVGDFVSRTLRRERGVLERALADELKGTGRSAEDVVQGSLNQAMGNPVEFSPAINGGEDSRNVTAGPMMGKPASAVLEQEVRRAAFAVHWLEATKIARLLRSPTENRGADVLQLVHDGGGPALIKWSQTGNQGHETAFRQLTASRGEHFVWNQGDPATERVWIGDDNKHTVAVNLNWRECRITAAFRKYVFVNCDFSGCRFEECEFEGVTFVNCLLDDANFENCTIRGGVDLNKGLKIGPETAVGPSFTIAAEQEARNFHFYYPAGVDVASFFSDTSGVPAVLGDSPPNPFNGNWIARFASSSGEPVGNPVVVEPASGGMAIVGGRICLLTLYRCRSEEDGTFAFHNVAGGGLDIVEHSGKVHIRQAAIRGISVSRDPVKELNPEAAAPARTGALDMTVDWSIITNAYFAGRVEKSSARFRSSGVFMLINASDNSEEGCRVTLDSCRHMFIVNAEVADTPGEDPSTPDTKKGAMAYFQPLADDSGMFVLRSETQQELATVYENMDFRLNPAEWEKTKRSEEEGSPKR